MRPIILLPFLFLSAIQGVQNFITPDDVLQKTADQLNGFQTVRYYHQRDYFDGDKHYFLQGRNYIDFHSTDSIIGLKYHIEADGNHHFFNGAESFTLRKEDKKIDINYKPLPRGMEGGSFFYNSLVTLRRTLPLIIADRSIDKKLTDTSIGGIFCYQVSFSLYKKVLSNFGGFDSVTEDRTFYFKLLIDKTTFRPVCLFQSNNADEHTSKITYADFQTNPTAPTADSWYYSSYLKEYAMAAKKERPLLTPGTIMPAFELPLFGTGKTINSRQYKGKLVLLEFWIRNCGPCIASVPKLNALQQQYKGKGLEVLAVNPHDAAPTITWFVDKYQPQYPVAYEGSTLARQWGVNAFPVVLIVNRNAEIIYAGGFDDAVIKEVLEKAF